MKKIICFIFLAFFNQFFIFRGLFSYLDSYTPENTSGNLILLALEMAVVVIVCFTIFILAIIERAVTTNLKYIYLSLLCLHCIFQFCCVAFFEYDLFNDPKSFDFSAITTILSYFVLELFIIYYVVNRLYKSVN
ncbi:hypothetical protein [Flavobacterium sp. HJSW_4]|uniref:hypothetical protein n=1 Tax=Flavobacterium sp. HJSW_4 TaxID=3344660 RepID=UPI0035F4DB18